MQYKYSEPVHELKHKAIFISLYLSSSMASNCNLVSVLGLLLVLTLMHNPVTVAGQRNSGAALFTFGDSNFDAGNKQTLTKTNVAQSFWPYGKSRDDPNGKFSDGFIAPDFLGTIFLND